MSTFLRRLRSTFAGTSTDTDGATFCDACGQVCTPDCRSTAQLERTRTRALLTVPVR